MTIIERIKKAFGIAKKEIEKTFGIAKKEIEKTFTTRYELAYPEPEEEYKEHFFDYVRHFQEKYDLTKEEGIEYTSEWLEEEKTMEEIDDMDMDDYIIWVEMET